MALTYEEQNVTVQNPSIAVTGPLTDTELRATPVPVTIPTPVPVTDNGGSLTVDGTVSITGTVSTTVGGTAVATVTNISVGTSSTTLSASNAAKLKVVVYNEQGTLFVKLGTTASSTSFSYKLTAGAVAEISGYTGVIEAIKQSGTTAVLVTEIGI